MILLVAQLELSSLRNVVRLIHSLSMEGDLADKVRVVVNRAGSDTVEDGITVKKAEEVIGKPIFWQVPNDSKAMIGSRVAGQPLVKYAPKVAGPAEHPRACPGALPARPRSAEVREEAGVGSGDN